MAGSVRLVEARKLMVYEPLVLTSASRSLAHCRSQVRLMKNLDQILFVLLLLTDIFALPVSVSFSHVHFIRAGKLINITRSNQSFVHDQCRVCLPIAWFHHHDSSLLDSGDCAQACSDSSG